MFEQVESVGPVRFDDSSASGALQFRRCVLRDEFSFKGARLEGALLLEDSTFHGATSFEGGVYAGTLHINRVEAKEDFSFSRVVISGQLVVEKSVFQGGFRQDEGRYDHAVVMRAVTVAGQAIFDEVLSSAVREFLNVTFEGPVSFRFGLYRDVTSFENVTFADEVTFEGALFEADITFRNVRFLGPVNFRDARFNGDLTFERVTFEGAVEFAVRAGQLLLKSVSFARQAKMILDDTDARIEEAKFAAPLTIDTRTSCRIRSLRGTDVTNLVLARVDMSKCAFSDAYNVDKLRVESAGFPLCPTKWWFSGRWPFVVKRTARRVVIEEAVARAGCQVPRPADGDWDPLLDGYGLRASRAVLCLLVLVLGCAT